MVLSRSDYERGVIGSGVIGMDELEEEPLRAADRSSRFLEDLENPLC